METTSEASLSLDFLGELRRTHLCGDLRSSDVGSRAVLMGWVHRRRDLGGLIFVHLRDRSGIAQIVFNTENDPDIHRRAEMLRSEYVIAVEGPVIRRSDDTINPDLATGEVEVVVEKLHVLNHSRTPPFLIEDDASVSEDVRLQYRYIDLRRPHMQRNILLREKVNFAIREAFHNQNFFEIETPFMTRSTPEGARDFLVPSRIQLGNFYALPQSPQLFKQLLMISGFDRYFQIVRCFRDEDLRADRQPEFTQIDLEMSFVQQDVVFDVIEKAMVNSAQAAGHAIPDPPFERLTYAEAMERYGSDKPDLRLPPMTRVDDLFPAGELTKDAMPLVAIRTPKVGTLTRRERDELKPIGNELGLRVFDDMKRLDRDFAEPMTAVRERVGVEEGDLLVLCTTADTPTTPKPSESALKAAGSLRLQVAQKYRDRHKLFNPADFRFLWVTDFPMFEWDEEEKRWESAHHPFTSVHDEDIDKLTTDPAQCRSKAYDLVLNGVELGSGSIRIHRRDVQATVFSALGFTEEEAHHRFGFFLEALEYGTPPHGGIALGLDRLIMILAGESTIRDVIPFPKTAKGTDLMCQAPSTVPNRALNELGVQLRPDVQRAVDAATQNKE